MMHFCFSTTYTVLLLLQSICDGANAVGVNDQPRDLQETETITTTACDVRVGGYQARLDMFYFYKVEYKDESSLDLPGLERALATSVASSLNECDKNMKPYYAVQLSSPSHELSIGGK
jgi:hypothetical protein